jgi:hypothetical protein
MQRDELKKELFLTAFNCNKFKKLTKDYLPLCKINFFVSYTPFPTFPQGRRSGKLFPLGGNGKGGKRPLN